MCNVVGPEEVVVRPGEVMVGPGQIAVYSKATCMASSDTHDCSTTLLSIHHDEWRVTQQSQPVVSDDACMEEETEVILLIELVIQKRMTVLILSMNKAEVITSIWKIMIS